MEVAILFFTFMTADWDLLPFKAQRVLGNIVLG